MTRRAASFTLLTEANQLDRFAFFGKYHMRFRFVARRAFRFVVTLKLLTSIGNHLLGADFSSERFLMTALPVDSDLMLTMGSSLLPTRVTLPPLRVAIVLRAPPMLVITPKVRLP